MTRPVSFVLDRSSFGITSKNSEGTSHNKDKERLNTVQGTYHHEERRFSQPGKCPSVCSWSLKCGLVACPLIRFNLPNTRLFLAKMSSYLSNAASKHT